MKNATGNMLIIKDAQGDVIGAQIETTADADKRTFISPADPQHTLHRVVDVPADICSLTHPVEFQKALIKHLKSPRAKVTLTNADEVRAALAGNQSSTANTSGSDLESENERLKRVVAELTLEKQALKEALAERR